MAGFVHMANHRPVRGPVPWGMVPEDVLWLLHTVTYLVTPVILLNTY